MTPEEFLNNLNSAIDRTARDIEPTMKEAALTAKALLARRVQNKGFGRQYISRGYKRIRARRGFEIRFVNLTFTGRMFQGWKRPGIYREGLKVGGTVGGIDEETRNKLRWNKSRYPKMDQVSQDEIDLLKENLIKPRLMEILKRNMLNP